MRSNHFYALQAIQEGEGEVMDSIFRDLYNKILTFNYVPIRCGWFCADLFTKSGKMLVLAFGCFTLQRRCLVKGASLSPIILCPVAMKETRGLTGFYRFLSLKSRTKILINIRIRFLTSIEARVGFAFMLNCVFQLHSALDSACLKILAISDGKVNVSGKGRCGLSRGNES